MTMMTPPRIAHMPSDTSRFSASGVEAATNMDSFSGWGEKVSSACDRADGAGSIDRIDVRHPSGLLPFAEKNSRPGADHEDCVKRWRQVAGARCRRARWAGG